MYITLKNINENKITRNYTTNKEQNLFLYCTIHTLLKHVVQKVYQALDQKKKCQLFGVCVCMCIESRHQLITLYNKYCKMGALNSRMLLMQNVHAKRLSQFLTALQIAFQELCIA